MKKTTLIIWLGCLILSIVFFMTLKTDFLPVGNQSVIQGLVQCQQGSSTNNTHRHQQKVNEKIREFPYQKDFNIFSGFPTHDQGVFYLRLVKANKRPSSVECAQMLRNMTSDIVGINTYLKPLPFINLQVGNSGALGEYQYILTSNNTDELYKSAFEFTNKLKELPELSGVNSDMRIQTPQITVSIDRDRAGVYGITAQQIESTLQFAYGGGRIATFYKANNVYDLILEVAPGFDLAIEDMDLLYIKAPSTNQLVPLNSVASWKEVAAASAVNHINTFPSVTISFNLKHGVDLGGVVKKLGLLASEILPQSVQSNVQGAAQVFVQTFQSLKWWIVIAIIVIYMLLGILYESFIYPFAVLSALPVAAVGGLATLWIFGLPLSLMSIVGLIVLVGLVQKNGIMLIDFAIEHLRIEDETPFTSIIEASKARFRPILMTTLAALFGALPIVIGFGENAETNRPLGLVVFGGLLISQAVTLFATPVIFLYMQQLQDRLSRHPRASTNQ